MDIGSGVFQGGVISPTLFTIAFNDLITRLKQKGFDAMAYADDLVIVEKTKEKLLEAVNIVE